MFEGITESLGNAFSLFRRGGRLSETNIRDGMRLVRQALLEADVNYEVATEFIKGVTEEAVGERVLKALNPTEQIVGIVYEHLVDLMGPVDHSLRLKRDGVTIIMMCGLQGSGKTTTCGKLARMLKREGWNSLLVAADLQRPAAIDQLHVIGEQIGIPVYSEPPDKSTPLKVCQNGLAHAKKTGAKVVILDTAGRLHIDDALMQELSLIERKLEPDQLLFVCDAMTGQDAVNSAKAFNEALELDGVILTKLDGDTRGGAALSIKKVADVPIKFIGVGEKLEALEEFHPDRMASRILGGGDMATLIEKAQREFDEDEMRQQQEALLKGKFTLNDFRTQMRQIKKLGSMKSIMKLIPGMGAMADMDPDANPEEDLKRIEGMIDSMTEKERLNPDIIDHGRRNRIAKGSGNQPADVNKLLKDFSKMADMMQKMAGLGMRDRMKMVQDMTQEGGMLDPNANGKKEKQRSKRGPQDINKFREERRKKKKDAKKQRRKNRR